MSRILIIDDNASIVAILTRCLLRAGHDIMAASDGESGVRAFREQGADLVITDIFMPGQDGIETILELRAHDPGARIIAMSGGDHTRTLSALEDAALLGALRTLPKPFETAELLRAVTEALTEPPA